MLVALLILMSQMDIKDLSHDGKINCIDYAIRNSQIAEGLGYEPRWIFVKTSSERTDHVVVVIEDCGSSIVLDGDGVQAVRK